MTNPADMKTSASEDLLIELGCEELPPKSLPTLARSFFKGFKTQLNKAELAFDPDRSRVYYTPRRLALLISNVSERQPDQTLERKGPALSTAFDADHQPTPAAIGFARSVSKGVDELETLKSDKGEWLFCRVEKPGQTLEKLLFPMLEAVLADLPVTKPMRWASNDFSFIRPVHWLLVIHGSKVVEGRLFGLKAGNTTRGHRIHSPGPHEVATANGYEQVLDTACVVADQNRRQDMIKTQAVELGKTTGGKALIDTALLEEVTNLVEWPRSICGSFDSTFLAVPSEALVASMQDHQKFFPVLDKDSQQLLARFIAVANLDSKDFDAVRCGFERVIQPRLADAQFFWEQDNKTPFADHLSQLGSVVFQNNLGTVRDKSQRIAAISKMIAQRTFVDVDASERAGLLCKCDLISHMVGEFPELQGIMGRYYALQSGEQDVVALAIGEHYLPTHSGDNLPTQAVGKVVALSDRLDTLTGIFASGLKPTGNKDPFALRRAALGVIRILLDGELNIELDCILEISTENMQNQLKVSSESVVELRQFILDRLKNYLREHDYETSLINAVMAAPLNTLPDLYARLNALKAFMDIDVADGLVAANKRIGNILRKSAFVSDSKVLEDLLIIEEERQVFADIKSISSKLCVLYDRANYTAALNLLAGMSSSIEAFFDHVMVMDDRLEIRHNRLTLLASVKGLFDRIANLALIG